MKKAIRFIIRPALLLFVLFNIITAFHAYKFTHFYDAGTVVVKNAAQKNKWDITKDILFGIDAVKQKSIQPDSTFQPVMLTTSGGIKLEAWYVGGSGNTKGTVILFHGHGSNKAALLRETAVFNKLGYNALLTDFRAHGNSGGNSCTIGWFESEEVKLAFDFIKGKGETNIVLWGISMGAAAITKAISDYDLKPAKLILEMPFASISHAAEGRIRLMKVPPQPLAAFILFWGSTGQGFWAFSMKPAEFVKKISMPVLLQWGRKDPRVQQTEIELIFKNIVAPKQLVIYEKAGHESLCKAEPGKWAATVVNFLNQ